MFKFSTVLNLTFITIIIPIKKKSKTPVSSIQLSHSNDFPCWMSIFFITMTPHLYQATPSFEATIDCHMKLTQFSNCFIVPIRRQHFWITYVPVIRNFHLSGNQFMFYIWTKKWDIRHESTRKWPVKSTDITSSNTHPNFPEKSSMIHIFVHYFLFLSFT